MSIDTNIKSINDKLQVLVKRYIALKKDNENLSEQLRTLETKKQHFDSTIENLNEKINILQASSGQMKDGNHKEFEKRINDYIKEIDKCIGLLSE
jgi:chromosome segregation ATPase